MATTTEAVNKATGGSFLLHDATPHRAEPTELDEYFSALERFAYYRPICSVQIRRRITRRLLDEERYVV